LATRRNDVVREVRVFLGFVGSFFLALVIIYAVSVYRDHLAISDNAISAPPLVTGSPRIGVPADGDSSRAQAIVLDPVREVDREQLQPRRDEKPAARMRLVRHTVRPGETLGAISKKYHGTTSRWREILEHNRDTVRDPRRLRPGMVLVIPGTEEPVPETEVRIVQPQSHTPVERPLIPETTYRVRRGDTLSGIAKRHYGFESMWRVIYDRNRDLVPNGNKLTPGATLVLPAR